MNLLKFSWFVPTTVFVRIVLTSSALSTTHIVDHTDDTGTDSTSNSSMTAWLFVTVLLLILMVGLFVVQRDIRKRTSPRDLMRVPFGMQSVECGACGVIQAGHVFICFSCSRANRLPVDDIRPDMSPVLVTVEGPLRKFKFKREGHNYFHETERLEMTAAEEAAHKGTPHSGVVGATVPSDLEQPTGPPGEVPHLDESNGEPQHGEVYGKTYSQNSNRSENSITSHISIRSNVGLPMCVVCLDAIGNVVLLPCAHGGICEGCATKIAQNHRAGGGKCPHCRTSIDTLVNLNEINGDVATGVEIRVPMAQARA